MNSSNAVSPRSSGVEYELNELGLQLNNLEELLDCLHSKISPIMIPLSMDSKGKDVGLMPAVSPIEEEIIIHTSRVRKLTGYVGEMLERAQTNK